MFNHDARYRDDDLASSQQSLCDAACPGAVTYGACECCPAVDFLVRDDDGVLLCVGCVERIAAPTRWAKPLGWPRRR